jgi:predicted amidohydrolase YtcJ
VALLGATRSIRAGDHNRTNRMFRARIYAQAFTLVAMVAGSMYWQTDRQKRKEFEGVIAEKKAREKNEAWIRELEARDEEEKELKAIREARRKGIPYVKEEAKKVEGKIEKEVKKMVRDVKEGKIKADAKDAVEDGEEKAEKALEEGVEKTKGILDSIREMVGGKK